MQPSSESDPMHQAVRAALSSLRLRIAYLESHPRERRVAVVVHGTCKLPQLVASQRTFTQQTGWTLSLCTDRA